MTLVLHSPLPKSVLSLMQIEHAKMQILVYVEEQSVKAKLNLLFQSTRCPRVVLGECMYPDKPVEMYTAHIP